MNGDKFVFLTLHVLDIFLIFTQHKLGW